MKKWIWALVPVVVLLTVLAACDIKPMLAVVEGLLDSSQSAGSGALKGGIKDLRITIDPGHGGIDSGAVGADSGVKEAVLNLQVSNLVSELFRDAGASVLQTRTTADVDYSGEGDTPKLKDMNSRAAMVKKQDPHALISIHMNMFADRTASGPQVFYQTGSEAGRKLAECIQDALNRGIEGSVRTPRSGDYFMTRVTESPSVIVECGFLSNADDEKKLQDPDYQQKLADCVYEGVCSYFGIR